VNGQLVCTHEGGFTEFDCEITKAVKAGDEQRGDLCGQHAVGGRRSYAEDGLVNYGGLTRDVSIVTVPECIHRRLRPASGPRDAEHD
jgi:beta-glucuronidase